MTTIRDVRRSLVVRADRRAGSWWCERQDADLPTARGGEDPPTMCGPSISPPATGPNPSPPPWLQLPAPSPLPLCSHQPTRGTGSWPPRRPNHRRRRLPVHAVRTRTIPARSIRNGPPRVRGATRRLCSTVTRDGWSSSTRQAKRGLSTYAPIPGRTWGPSGYRRRSTGMKVNWSTTSIRISPSLSGGCDCGLRRANQPLD